MKNEDKTGIVITYYGDGKGKTTAALGLVLRSCGYGKKIFILQFIKGDWKSGEELSVQKLQNVKIVKYGLGFIGIQKDRHKLSDHHKAAQNGLGEAQKAIRAKWDVIVLDEILGAIKARLVTKGEVLKLIKEKKNNQVLVLTGRPKIKSIIEASDLVSEIKKIKHPYDKGRLAIKGVDF